MSAFARHRFELTVPFHDCDMMQVVWHGNYFRYLELARCALLQTIDYDYPQMRDSGYAWPIIDAQIRYIASASYNQHIAIDTAITEWENRLRMEYLIIDATSGRKLCKARTDQVAVKIPEGELQLCSPLILGQKLGLR
jgi:acyl-CoA thioester hydrolase